MNRYVKEKVRMLRKKALTEMLSVPDDVLYYIAEHIAGGNRILEMALLQVVSSSILLRVDLDVNLAAEILSARISKCNRRKTHNKSSQINNRKSTYLKRSTAIAAASGLLVLSGCGTSAIAQNTKPVQADVLSSATGQDSQQQDVTLSGRAEPFQQVPIYAPTTGNIKNLLVKLGDYVHIGQNLADIDGNDLAYKIKQASSQVQQSELEAQMKTIQQQLGSPQSPNSSSVSTTADIETAKSKMQDLQFTLTQAEQNWQRVKNNQTVPTDLTQAQNAMNQLQQQLNAAKQTQDAAAAKVQSQQQSSQNQTSSVDPALLQALNAATANVTQLQAAFGNAQDTYVQLKNQLQQQSANEDQLAQAAAAKDQAQYQLNAAQQMVNNLLAQGARNKQTAAQASALQQQLDQASATLANLSVEQAQMDLQNLQDQANNLKLVAPINGFITEPTSLNGFNTTSNGSANSNSSAGTSNGSSSGPMFVISNLDQVYVKMDAPEAMIGKIQLNQGATVTFPAIGKTFTGKVVYIGEMADTTTNTYPVRILIDNKAHLIRGGMQAQVTLN